MLKAPLHHAYVVRGSFARDIEQLKQAITQAVDGQPIFDLQSNDDFDIQMARELKVRARNKTGKNKYVLIRGFENASRAAQNAILKVLEEPAAGTHIFLVTPAVEKLQETIHSRCEQIFLGGKTHADIDKTVTSFISAEDLPARLQAVSDLDNRQDLRTFITACRQRIDPAGQPKLARALTASYSWVSHHGSSVKVIREYIAIAGSR